MIIKDLPAREQALNPFLSLIVSAPAGSGKTYLLTRRILNLLMHVELPSHIVAITFTKKAAAEMKARLLDCLENPEEDIAKQVLKRDQEKNWQLLTHPDQLAIMTIDAYCGWLLAHSHTPFGLPISQDPMSIYREVIYQYYQSPTYDAHQNALLDAFYGQYSQLETLLQSLLATRDQWQNQLSHEDLATSCQLGITLLQKIHIEQLQTITKDHKPAFDSLFSLHKSIADELEEPVLFAKHDTPRAYYETLASLLLTATGDIRKSFNKRQGIYPKSRISQAVLTQQMDFLKTVDHLRDTLSQEAITLLHEVRLLPTHQHITEHDFLTHLSVVLSALSERLIQSFKDHGYTDFTQVAQDAILALKEDSCLQQFCKANIHHVLIDEFQDTSSLQYTLLTSLINLWPPNTHRTLFTVGDPMQSIYRFRQADVRLFLSLQNESICHLKLTPVSLACNFRSSSVLIERVNQLFTHIFPKKNQPFFQGIAYHQAIATRQANIHDNVYLHIEKNSDSHAQATCCINLIQSLQEKHPGDRIAVLVQARSHLKAIIPKLQEANILFNAIDIYPIVNLTSIQDLTALLCIIVDPYDRLSLLTVLRSPLCGLSLESLLSIADTHTLEALATLTPTSHDEPFFQRFYQAFKEALAKSTDPLSQVNHIWYQLQGDRCYPQNQQLAISSWFQTIEKRCIEQLPIDRLSLLACFHSSYTQQTHLDANVYLLTAHKAKGLEYEHVIIPHLEKKKPPQSLPLFYTEAGEHPIIQPTFTDNPQNINYFKLINKKRDQFENERLLYVAATRAKSTLHCLGHMTDEPPPNTWLSHLWGAYRANIPLTVVYHDSASKQSHQNVLPPKRFMGRLQPIQAPQPLHQAKEQLMGTGLHYYLQYFTHPDLPRRWQQYCLRHLDIKDALTPYISQLEKHRKHPLLNWIFANHAWAHNEFHIGYQGKHYIIDRIFIQNDICFIIDYKFPTHSPSDHLLLKQYQEQLNTYEDAVLAYFNQDITIITALLLPLSLRLISKHPIPEWVQCLIMPDQV